MHVLHRASLSNSLSMTQSLLAYLSVCLTDWLAGWLLVFLYSLQSFMLIVTPINHTMRENKQIKNLIKYSTGKK